MLYLPKPLRLLKKFGRDRLHGRDFMQLIHDNGIELVFAQDVRKGFYYYTPKGKHVIVLSTLIPHAERAQVGWHEFAHFLQNYRNPVTTIGFCNVGEKTPLEKLADNFAFVCVTGVQLCGRGDFLEMLMDPERMNRRKR